jgi:hypothetical protein
MPARLHDQTMQICFQICIQRVRQRFASLFFEAGQAKSCMQQCSQTFFFRKTLTFVEEETVKAYSLQPKAYGV